MSEDKTNSIQSRSDLKNLEGYHSPQLDLEVRLNTNESPFQPPKKFLKLLQKALGKTSLNRYPDRDASNLKKAIAEFHNLDASGQGVIVGNGSNEIIQSILLAYAGESGKVAMFEPTYGLHSHISRIVGAEIITGRRNVDWQIELDEFKAVLKQSPSVVFLCVPNNPTGTCETKEFLSQAAELVADANALLIVDEAYADLQAEANIWRQDLPVAVVRTFSKSWSLAGLRLGYLVAPDWIINEVQKVILPYNLNVVSQIAGELIFDFKEFQVANSQKLVEGRDFLYSKMKELNESREKPVFKIWESHANFIFFKVIASEFSAEDIWEELIQKSIMIRYYDVADRALDECLRVTIGENSENIRFLEALEAIIK